MSLLTLQVTGSVLTPYASNPTQTAASGVDTQYTFGPGGSTPFNGVMGQNNSAVNVFLAIDQDTTVSGNEIYTVAPGQSFSFERSGSVLHFSSPSQVDFGGQSGLTVAAIG